VAVFAVVAAATGALPGLSGPDAGAVPGVIPPIIGNTTIGLSDAPAAIQAFEAEAIQKVMTGHDLPAGDAAAVQAWGRNEVAAQEWVDIVRIINKPFPQRTAQETAVYDWMAGLIQARRVADAQAAVDEFRRWSGMTEAQMAQSLPPDPSPTTYCGYQPPGGSTGPFKGTYTTLYDQNCSTHGCTNFAGCPTAYPTVKQFSQWGAYAVAQQDVATPEFANRAAGVATTVSLAAALSIGGSLAPLALALVQSGIAPALQLTALFPFSVRAATVGAIASGAVGAIVGTVIFAAVTIALEIYRIASNAEISQTLITNRNKAQATVPDLKAELATTAGLQTLYTAFLRETMPDVDYGCTGTASGSTGPACANAPAPVAPDAANDPRFIVAATRNGVGDIKVSPTIYGVDPTNPATALRTRLSGNGWFVSTSYDLNQPTNVAAPTAPSVAQGSDALLNRQSLRFVYQDWDNKKWAAERTKDSEGKDAFVIASLDPAANGSCASTIVNTTKNNCVTRVIAYREPDGTKALAQIVPASAAVPAVTAQVPPVVAGNSVQQLSATATSQLGTGPYTYQWNVGGTPYTGATPTVTFPSGPGLVSVTVNATNSQGNTGSATTLVQVLAPTAVTVLTKSFDAVAGQPVTLVARVKNLGCPGEAFGACTRAATGRVQFSVDGRPVGAPVSLGTPCPGDVCTAPVVDFNSTYAVSDPIDDLTPTARPVLNSTTGIQAGQIDGPGHSVTAQYLGDANFLGASGGLATAGGAPSVFGLRVRQAVPTIALDAPSYPGAGWDKPVTLHAKVSPPAGLAAVPSGTVGFAVNGTKVGTPVVIDANGDASLTTTLTALKAGAAPYQFAARYSGSDSFEQAAVSRTTAPTKPGFGAVPQIATTHSPIVVPFSRPVMGVSRSTMFVQRSDSGANVPVKIACRNAVGATVSCAKGPVSALSMTPTKPWIPNMNYLVYIASPSATALRGYPDGTVMQPDGVMRRAPATFDAFGDAVTYQWGMTKLKAALGGSYREERYPGATASFKATGPSVGVITRNGPDGGIANVTVTSSTGAVVHRTIDTYAATVGNVTTSIGGLPAGRHTVVISVTGTKSAASTGTWVRVDGTISNGKIAKSPALTPARWPSYPGSYAYTGSTKATVEFAFSGTALDWTALVGPNNGKVSVTIDRKVVAPALDLYAAGYADQTFHHGGLAPGAHTVVITTLGQRNPASTDTVATFRRFTAG
jgi:hypothetical protein